MGVVEINVGSFLWYGVGIVPCVFFIEPVRTAIPRNYHKSRIWDLEERGRAGGGGGGGGGEYIPYINIYSIKR